MAYWVPTYLHDMQAYIDNPNVYMYGRWNHPASANEGGVDLTSPGGTPVYALADGKVIGLGNFWHSGPKTLYVPDSGPPGYGVVTTRVSIPGFGSNDLYYQHIQIQAGLKNGAAVKRGQQIGTVTPGVNEVEIGLNADWGGIWGTNHPQAWVTDPRPQIKALMALGEPGKVANNGTGTPLILRAFCDQVVADLAGGSFNQSQKITSFMISWAHHEGGAVTNACQWNPLNTMQDEPGASQCPGTLPGIKMYPDDKTGIKATVDALKNGNYPSLVHALTTSDENNLGFNGHPMAANIAGDLSMWVNGKRSPLAQSYILAIMAGAGIPGAQITGGTASGGTATPQATIDAWGNTSLGIDTGGITVGGTAGNVLSGLENLNTFFGQLSGFFSDPVRLVKIVAGSALVVAGLVLMVRAFAPGVGKIAKGVAGG